MNFLHIFIQFARFMKTLTYPRAGAIHPLLIGVRFLVKSEPTILCQMSITMAFVASKGDSFVIQPLNALCLPLGESEMLSYPFPDIYGNQNIATDIFLVCVKVMSASMYAPRAFLMSLKVSRFQNSQGSLGRRTQIGMTSNFLVSVKHRR